MSEVLENDKIEISPLNKTPSLYQSFTDSLTKTRIKGGRSVYGGLFRLKKTITTRVNIAAAVVNPMTPSGVDPVYLSIELDHGVQSVVPFIFSYQDVFRESLIIPEPTVGRKSFSLQIINYNSASAFDFQLTFYVYELLVRN